MATVSSLQDLIRSKRPSGISAAESQTIVKAASGPDKKLSTSERATLKTAVTPFTSDFTASGAKEFGRLSGISVVTGPDGAPVPPGWGVLSGDAAAKALKQATADEANIYLRTKSGAPIALDSSVDYSALARDGKVGVLVDPQDWQDDPNDSTGAPGAFHAGYSLVIDNRGSFASLTPQLDALAKSGLGATKAANAALEDFRSTVHAARVNELGGSMTTPAGQAELKKIKAEARAAGPVLLVANEKFQASLADWQRAAAAVVAPAGSSALVDAVKEQTKPTSNQFGFTLESAQAIIKAQDLIFDRPEVMSIDQGFGEIRIDVLVPTLVKNGGTFEGYAQEVSKLFRRNGLTMAPDSVDPHSHLDELQDEIQNTILKPALGTNFVDGYGTSGSDGDANAVVSFAVKAGGLATAKALIPEIKAKMKPYGFQTFGKKIEFDVQ